MRRSLVKVHTIFVAYGLERPALANQRDKLHFSWCSIIIYFPRFPLHSYSTVIVESSIIVFVLL